MTIGTLRTLITAGGLLCLASGVLAQQTVYVSAARGNDTTGDGTTLRPYATIAKAISTPATSILVAEGTYTPAAAISLGSGRRLVGGLLDADFKADATAVTRIELPTIGGQAGLTLLGSSRAEYLELAGGLRSVDLRATSTLFRCTLREGALGAMVRATDSSNVTVDGCQFINGSVGLETANTATLRVEDCLFDNQGSIALNVRRSSTVTVLGSKFTGADNDSIIIQEDAGGVIRNSIIERSQGSGIRALGTNPVIESCLITLNREGVSAEQGAAPIVRNCTIARNRASGLLVNESKPDLRDSILAENLRYGVEEIDELTSSGPVVGNLFSNNTIAQYLEAGTLAIQSQAQLNADLDNDGAVTGNLVGPAGFVNSAAGNFDLTTESLALDRVTVGSSLEVDVRGVPRAVNVEGYGNESGNISDLGAVERQPFGRTSWDFTAATDGFSRLEDLVVFSRIWIDQLPGRFLLWTDLADSFGIVQQDYPYTTQSDDTILIARYRLATEGNDVSGAPSLRVRLNGLYEHVFHLLYIVPVNTQSQAPPPEGRDYYLVCDFESAGLRTDPTRPPMEYYGALDWLEFGREPGRTRAYPAIAWEEAEYIELPRATFDARFQPLTQYRFDTGDDGWTFSTITPPFDPAFARYNPVEQALEMAPISTTTFGTWSSPDIDIRPGDLVRMTWTVSSPEPDPNRVSGFRLRLSSRNYEYTTYLRIDPTGGRVPGVAPTSTGNTYTSYAYIPTTMPTGGVNDKFFLAFELYGFSTNQSTRPIRLKDVKVDRATGPLLP